VEGPDSMLSSSAASGGMRLVERKTLTGVGNAFDFQNLSILTGRIYKLYVYADNSTANNSVISIYLNHDTTATNYYSQLVEGIDAVPGAARANNASCGYLGASSSIVAEYTILRSPDGYCFVFASTSVLRGAGVYYDLYCVSKTSAETNITRIEFTSQENMKAGATATLYAMP